MEHDRPDIDTFQGLNRRRDHRPKFFNYSVMPNPWLNDDRGTYKNPLPNYGPQYGGVSALSYPEEQIGDGHNVCSRSVRSCANQRAEKRRESAQTRN